VQLTTLVVTHLPDLTLAQLHARINVHGLPGLAPDADLNQLAGDRRSLEQSLQRNVSDDRRADMRKAFQLRNWRSTQLTGFMGAAEVKRRLRDRELDNPARWLYLFARYHQAPPAVHPPNNVYQAVNVNHAAHGPRTINLDGSLVDHLLNRHTFHHFAFHDPDEVVQRILPADAPQCSRDFRPHHPRLLFVRQAAGERRHGQLIVALSEGSSGRPTHSCGRALDQLLFQHVGRGAQRNAAHQ
jgi:hypothetical protein